MAVGADTIKFAGRLIFDLQRGNETTSRTIEVPFANTDGQEMQQYVNAANTNFTNSANSMNVCIQPANWRDTNITEQQWTTTGVRYEIVTTTTTPITPDETPDTLGSAQQNQEG